jgi:hypothetical protein
VNRAAQPGESAGGRRVLAAVGLASGLACASCNGVLSGLAQNAPMFLTDPGPSARTGRGVGEFSSVGAEKCHPVESVVIQGGERVPSYGRACQMPDGSWVVTASTDPERAIDAISGRPAARQRAALYGPGAAFEDPWCSMGRHGFMMGPLDGGYRSGLRYRQVGRRR